MNLIPTASKQLKSSKDFRLPAVLAQQSWKGKLEPDVVARLALRGETGRSAPRFARPHLGPCPIDESALCGLLVNHVSLRIYSPGLRLLMGSRVDAPRQGHNGRDHYRRPG